MIAFYMDNINDEVLYNFIMVIIEELHVELIYEGSF